MHTDGLQMGDAGYPTFASSTGRMFCERHRHQARPGISPWGDLNEEVHADAATVRDFARPPARTGDHGRLQA
ncbi:hypothetical protein [Streptomyces chartreusis]|uniref:hypothetical protein n=1 Tax=Streptomyces chartreusis TaxID=1969 RepID=UPI00367DA752